ncbi:hypothetical protein B0T25DRAFT_523743 [Lasiosphaeria hispida]|uniref:Amidoligase enzyme n=1 Tax=Lasiosphaeria hispida TaxID=260671 RepID=A0AAJ0H657_9PEZI|nr:hypothetical protein B0T25DRAFT_557309 [Lasiosphaeria hispida]KAK3362204.1 hypothetical protein B0T25DRAFT_523743 [Lasiosphaeria hispida]
MYLVPDVAWDVGYDSTPQDPSNLGVNTYHVQGVEVRSPPMRDCPESYQHLQDVIDMVVKNFRTRVNPTCGLHVHVGSGVKPAFDNDGDPLLRGGLGDHVGGDYAYVSRPHSLRVLKRAACLLWALDGFMCHIHPPERGFNTFCRSIRQLSNLALDNYSTGFGGNVKGPDPCPPDIPVEKESYRDTFKRLSDKRFPALRPSSLDADAITRLASAGIDPVGGGEDDLPVVNRTVMDGVHGIMQCREHRDVEFLMQSRYSRANYNFMHYQDFQNENPPSNSLLTIEFREAAGSVSPTWTTTYARICVGIFNFARNASRERFLKVISRLAQAEKAAMDGLPNKYDIISALQDMALYAPAAYLEAQLSSDPLRFWYPNRVVYNDNRAHSDEVSWTTEVEEDWEGRPAERW